MRADLPPVCRLIAPANSAQAAIGGLFGSDKTSQHHRALADLEERLQVFVGRHSIARLSAALADPTLKLDEVSPQAGRRKAGARCSRALGRAPLAPPPRSWAARTRTLDGSSARQIAKSSLPSPPLKGRQSLPVTSPGPPAATARPG